jgi:hypothetical protein
MKPLTNYHFSAKEIFNFDKFSNKIPLLFLALFLILPFNQSYSKFSEVKLLFTQENQDLATLGFNFPEYLSYVVFNNLDNSKSIMY